MKAEELYKKDEDITAEGYIYKHTFELDGIRNNLGILGFIINCRKTHRSLACGM